jgi:hypothetical protein
MPRLRWLFLAVLFTPSFAAARGFVCEAHGGPAWREVASEHFLLRTDLDSGDALKTAAQLEELRALLEQAMFGRAVATASRLEVVAFSRREEFEEFAPGPKLAGFFARDAIGRQRAVLGDGLAASYRVVIAHELAHYLAHHEILPASYACTEDGCRATLSGKSFDQ